MNFGFLTAQETQSVRGLSNSVKNNVDDQKGAYQDSTRKKLSLHTIEQILQA